MNPPNGHFFAQNVDEFSELLNRMNGSKSVLEIGSRYGESLRWFAKNCLKESRIVSVDLGYCVDSGERSGRWLINVCGEIAEEHDIYMIEGDSHDPKIIERVKSLGPYDFVFIDGDHSKEGVREDWKNYGPMGKIVAFHDICCLQEVGELWAEILQEKKCEFFWNEKGGMGIGVVYQ